MTNNTRFLFSLTAVIAVMAFVTVLYAAVPQTMNYQGYLTNSSGQPVNGTVNLTFKLYNSASGGAALWTETQNAVNVNKGVYSVVLGTVTPIALPFDTQYYLGVTVGAGAEMAPRQALAAAGTAFRAAQADALTLPATTVSIQNITINGVGCTPSGVPPACNITQGDRVEFDVAVSSPVPVTEIGWIADFSQSPRIGRTLAASDAVSPVIIHFSFVPAQLYIEEAPFVALAVDSNGHRTTSPTIVLRRPPGNGSNAPGQTCKTILQNYPGSASGTYSIDPDLAGPGAAYQAYCDMTTDGGGWTLWASLMLSMMEVSGSITSGSGRYMDNIRFAALLAASSDFMVRGSGSTRFYLSKAEAAAGNCNNLSTSAPEYVNATDSTVYGHRETAGCDLQGGDAAFLSMQGNGLYVMSSSTVGLWHSGSSGGPTLNLNLMKTDGPFDLYIR